MRKYRITSRNGGKLNLYSDAEFAAVMWRDVERDPLDSISDDVVTITLRKGEEMDAEWLGFELVDGDLINYLRLSQASLKRSTYHSYDAWIPADILDVRKTEHNGFEITKISNPL